MFSDFSLIPSNATFELFSAFVFDASAFASTFAFALPCCSEIPAPTCSQGVHGGLPWTEFTFGKACSGRLFL